jgi:hypothetical protein
MASTTCWNRPRESITSTIWNVIGPPVPDDLRADLHQPVPQRRRRPLADRVRQGQGAEEVGEIIGQGVQLQPHRVGGDAAADRRVQTAAFFPSLMYCPAVPRRL